MNQVKDDPQRRLRQEHAAFAAVLEPVAHPDVRARLREIAIELKHMDGEHWAVGEMLERACIVMDAGHAGAHGPLYVDPMSEETTPTTEEERKLELERRAGVLNYCDNTSIHKKDCTFDEDAEDLDAEECTCGESYLGAMWMIRFRAAFNVARDAEADIARLEDELSPWKQEFPNWDTLEVAKRIQDLEAEVRMARQDYATLEQDRDHQLCKVFLLEVDRERLGQKCEALEQTLLNNVDGVWVDYEAVKYENGWLLFDAAHAERELGEAREALTPLLALQVKCIHCAHIKVLHIPWQDDEGKERWGDCQRHLCKCPGWPTPAALPQEPGEILSQDDFHAEEDKAHDGH